MKTFYKILSLFLSVCFLLILFVSCGKPAQNTENTEFTSQTNAEIPEIPADVLVKKGTEVKKYDCRISLNTDSAEISGKGAEFDTNTVKITKSGTYLIEGTLNGRIVVDTDDKDKVKLVFNGVGITYASSSPVYVEKAPKKVVIYTQKDSVNIVSDGTSYSDGEDIPNAAIYGKDDIKFDGNGTLYVYGNYNKGIYSKNDIEISDGSLFVCSEGAGIQGKDSVEISGGNIVIKSKGDGIKSNDDTDQENKGYIRLSGGTVSIETEKDGIQAQTSVEVSACSLTVKTGGGSASAPVKQGEQFGPGGPGRGGPGGWGNPGGFNPGGSTNTDSETTVSTKGIKAKSSVSISEGAVISIDSYDDAVHSDDKVVINGGDINISAGDDGIHADKELTINGGEIKIAKSYEGLEAEVININDGNISITASDDGINAAGKSSATSSGGRPGSGGYPGFGVDNGTLNITGGTVIIDANGDGIDSNGSISMTGGTIVVYGPTENMNGAIDYETKFAMSGGTILAVGSSGMAEKPTGSGNVCVMQVNVSIAAGKYVCIQDESGNTVAVFKTVKQIRNIVFASESLSQGTYTVMSGGTYSGNGTYGLLTDGEYSGGSKSASTTAR